MDTLGTFMFPLLIIGIFYMLVFRPQQKKMKQHQNMVSNLAKGDEVVTAGGLIGKVTKIKADSNEIEVQFAKDLPSVNCPSYDRRCAQQNQACKLTTCQTYRPGATRCCK